MKKIYYFLLTALLTFIASSGTSVYGQLYTPEGWWKFDNTNELLKAETGTSMTLIESKITAKGAVTDATLSELVSGQGPKSEDLSVTLPGVAAGTAKGFPHTGFKVQTGVTSTIEEYTLVYDVQFTSLNTSAHYDALFTASQTNDDSNWFRKGYQLGYTYYTTPQAGNLNASDWYRVILSVPSAGNATVYCNGQSVRTVSRAAIPANFFYAFMDLDDGERHLMKVSQVAVYKHALSATDVTTLGNALVEIPTSKTLQINATHITGGLPDVTQPHNATPSFTPMCESGWVVASVTYTPESESPQMLNPDGGGAYTLPAVTANATLEITTIQAQNTVTVTAGEGINITSPVLDGSNQFSAASTATITFTLAAGYKNPTVASISGTTAGGITPEGNAYSLTLSGITDGATVTISAVVALPAGVNASNANNQYWYTIKNGSNALLFPGTVGNEVTSTTFTADNASHYVKFVAEGKGFKIVTHEDYEMKTFNCVNTVVASGSGSIYTFADNGTVSVADASLKGLYEFNTEATRLTATAGNDLEYRKEPTPATQSSFGGTEAYDGSNDFTWETGVNSGDGAVLVPADHHFFLNHGIGVNGGGSTKVNEYTLLIDFKSDLLTGDGNEIKNTLLQTDITNTNDGEVFVRNNGQVGKSSPGYVEAGVQPATWTRYALIVNQTSVIHYKDAVNKGSKTLSKDHDYHLNPNGVLIFADEDYENKDIHCSTIAIWDRALSASEIAALGSAGATICASTSIAVEAEFLSQPNPSTSLPTVIADDAPVRYYNLQGIQVSSPVKGNIYIVKQGAVTKKVLIK